MRIFIMNMLFELKSQFKPMGDQPEAIRQLVEGVNDHLPAQTLLGVTGSGKTFTMANVIAETQKPTLILSHNKTLAAQLYAEMRSFFPDNAVEYYVSYYDYFQPEAYLPSTDTYIEKDLAINMELDQLRLSAVNTLLSGRRDVVVVSSVSCIYGMGNPQDFHDNMIPLRIGQMIDKDDLLRRLVNAQYTRNDIALQRGNFQAKGDTIDVFLVSTDIILRVILCFDEIESIETMDVATGHLISRLDEYTIPPASIFTTTKERVDRAVDEIVLDLGHQIQFFESLGDSVKAERIKERVTYDVEMIKEVGYCTGIENYSRYFDGRKPGERPFCLLDCFPDDFLMIVDESHVTVPQIRGMGGNDRTRKTNLVENGFRLPSAYDNRPLNFEEFESLVKQVIFVSATPANYELQRCEGVVAEQLIRPTGLLDPLIEVRPSVNQIDDLLEEIQKCVENDDRAIVTTFTKRLAEELDEYMREHGVRSSYLHSEVDTLDRVRILDELRAGEIDVVIGVNLLREGIDLPEVSLVAILDADKEGFLRNETSLTQTVGRAARNLRGKAIMYADTITKSMQRTIDETERRRAKQMRYNAEHGITPKQIVKGRNTLLDNEQLKETREMFGAVMEPTGKQKAVTNASKTIRAIADDAHINYENVADLKQEIDKSREAMMAAAKALDFIEAARLRDYMLMLQERVEKLSRK